MPRSIFVLLLALTAAACGREGTPSEGTVPTAEGSVPQGRLGHPIGTFLRIEGVRAEAGKVGQRTLLVDLVNGSKCSPPVGIWVDNIDLPSGARCAISGYETGRWIGVPPGVELAENLPPSQALWQFQVVFMATSAQAPDSLVEELRKR